MDITEEAAHKGDVVFVHVHDDVPEDEAAQLADSLRERAALRGIDVVVLSGAIKSVSVARGAATGGAQRSEQVDVAVIVAGHQVLVAAPVDAGPRWIAVAAAKHAGYNADDGAFIDSAELRDREGALLTDGRADQFTQPLYLDLPSGAGG